MTRRRLMNVLAGIFLLITVVLVAWQGSFKTGVWPADTEQTFVFFGLSTIIFLVMLSLGFLIVRLVVKIWVERRADKIGSSIRTKLVIGALALSLMPVFFMVLESVYVLNRTLERWFTRPVEHERIDFVNLAKWLQLQIREKANIEAQFLASKPETLQLLTGSASDTRFLEQFGKQNGVMSVKIFRADQPEAIATWGKIPLQEGPAHETARAPVFLLGGTIGTVILTVPIPLDIAQQERDIAKYDKEFAQMRDQRKFIRASSLGTLSIIALFILFVSGWLAQLFARQISTPISALLQGAEEVSKGNLKYRVNVNAVDELARLVDGFNRMTSDLEGSRAEIESRRRFTEAILESIPSGVISVDGAGRIQLVNSALRKMFPAASAERGKTLDELFTGEDAAEIRYLMNRARRTGLAAQQFEIQRDPGNMQLAITVSALEGRRSSGFVIVIEDTSELLQAQKSAAWSEVARRVAHEIKNPLTPIALSAERMLRQRQKYVLPAEMDRLIKECAETILDNTSSVKRLVDEFSQFSRLPAAKPVPAGLNDMVRSGLSVFEDRLEGIEVDLDLAEDIPPVLADPEQFKRVVINLVDNAAEAMQDSAVKHLSIRTRITETESAEIIFADSGCGVTPDQKEKLFLPYFSTKGRGTGLGLAIVSHILSEHGASIRVEDNKPSGTIFTIEIPVPAPVIA